MTYLVRLWASSVAISIAFAMPLNAMDVDGNFAVRGLGGETCSNLIAALQDAETTTEFDAFVSWLQGYTTAHNRLREDTFDTLPMLEPNSIGALVISICDSFPDRLVETAANSLLDYLSAARVRATSDLIQLQSNDRTLFLRQETLERILGALSARGHLDIEPSEVSGQALQSALLAFQAESELQQSGIPDADTIIRLLVEGDNAR